MEKEKRKGMSKEAMEELESGSLGGFMKAHYPKHEKAESPTKEKKEHVAKKMGKHISEITAKHEKEVMKSIRKSSQEDGRCQRIEMART